LSAKPTARRTEAPMHLCTYAPTEPQDGRTAVVMPRQKILVLGAGMIGSAIAMDLARRGEWQVTVADVSRKRLAEARGRYGVLAETHDLSRTDVVAALAADHDLVVDALPSAIGFQTLRAVIDSGRPAVDVT